MFTQEGVVPKPVPIAYGFRLCMGCVWKLPVINPKLIILFIRSILLVNFRVLFILHSLAGLQTS